MYGCRKTDQYLCIDKDHCSFFEPVQRSGETVCKWAETGMNGIPFCRNLDARAAYDIITWKEAHPESCPARATGRRGVPPVQNGPEPRWVYIDFKINTNGVVFIHEVLVDGLSGYFLDAHTVLLGHHNSQVPIQMIMQVRKEFLAQRRVHDTEERELTLLSNIRSAYRGLTEEEIMEISTFASPGIQQRCLETQAQWGPSLPGALPGTRAEEASIISQMNAVDYLRNGPIYYGGPHEPLNPNVEEVDF